MQDPDEINQERSLCSVRAMEIVVSLLLLGGSAVVIKDSARLGFGWQEGEGPAAGYFPFYIALVLGAVSLVNLLKAVLGRDPNAATSFVSRRAIGRVLAVFVPAIGYVAAIHWLGLYVASGLFIASFMLLIGRESPVRALLVGLAVPFFSF